MARNTLSKRGVPIARIIPARQIGPALMAEADELIIRIKASRKGSTLPEEEYREAVEEGRG